MGAGTSAEEFFLKSINVESIFEFVERTDYLFLFWLYWTLPAAFYMQRRFRSIHKKPHIKKLPV